MSHDPDHVRARRWAIVLSGGEGERMRPFITRWQGAHRPKQYCAFTGRRSMLEHTLERAAAFTAPERIVTVIGRGHWAYLDEPRRLEVPGRIIEQPANLDTGPGVFLPLAYVLAEEPEATVLLLPSDHFIAPNERFRVYAGWACALAELQPDRLVLLGAPPSHAEPDYGWIEPGAKLKGPAGGGARGARRFIEKPEEREASRILQQGALWNTMILAAKASTLWNLGVELRPSMMKGFQRLLASIGTPSEADVLARIYGEMEGAGFSRDILGPASDRLAVVTLADVDWSDWGRPERVEETLLKNGLVPAWHPFSPSSSSSLGRAFLW